MKIKRLILLLMLSMSLAAMEKDEIVGTTGPQASQTDLGSIPEEIKVQIIPVIAQADTIQDAILSLRALSAANKEFYRLVNDPKVTEQILDELIKKFPAESDTEHKYTTDDQRMIAAIALNTNGARNWLQQNHPNWLQVIKAQIENLGNLLVYIGREKIKIWRMLMLNQRLAQYLAKEYRTKSLIFFRNATFLHEVTGILRDYDFVNDLVKAGADVNAQDLKGSTPLMNAAFEGDVGIVKLLLDANANPFLQNQYGHTAYTIALPRGNAQIIKLLEEAEKRWGQKLHPALGQY